MINLLPPKEKEMLMAERTNRLAMVWGIIVLSAIICLVFVLLSIYFYALGDVKSQSFYLREAERSYQSPDFETFKSIIQKYNKILPQVGSFYEGEKSFADALSAIYAVPRPEGVLFTSLSLDGSPKQNMNKKSIFVSIAGTSATRENLIFFQNNLLKEELIENVSFSPESWISSKNTNFNVAFNLMAK